MYYSPEQLTIDQKKSILKRRLLHILSTASFWLFIGYIAGFVSVTYGVTETLKTVEKVIVCK